MINWFFKINGEEIEEPIGWDAVELTLQRSEVYLGLENIYSDNILFWNRGAEIINAAYEAQSIDADLFFQTSYHCEEPAPSIFVEGILNAYFYSVKNNEVTIKIEPSGFQRDFKNNLDQTINLSSYLAIDGVTHITLIEPVDIGLHSKAITYEAVFEIENDTDSKTFNPAGDTLYCEIPLVLDSSEGFDDLTEFVAQPYLHGSADTAANQFQRIFRNGTGKALDIVIGIDVAGSIIVNPGANFPSTATRLTSLKMSIGATYDSSLFVPYDLVAPHNVTYTTGLNTTVPLTSDLSGTFTIPDGYNVYISFVIVSIPTDNTSPQPWSIRTNFDKFEVKFKSLNTVDPSVTKAYPVYEMLRKMCESMTGKVDCFRSNFFGRTDLGYSSNGCGAFTAITNGLNVRNMLDKEGNRFPVNAVFSALFQDLSCIYSLGMRVEKENGEDIVRIEPAEYFYNATTIKTFFNVSDLTRTPAVDVMYNKFIVGYEKWNLNISGINALDEINAQHTYSLPVKKAAKTLEKKSKLIASGYLIEQTRRIQYKKSSTTDFETDNDLIIICLNRGTVVSDKYTANGESRSYAAGTVSERNEAFSGITNLLDPDTIYNLRISPARMAANWYPFISSSFWKATEQQLRFVSGLGNFLEGDTLSNCEKIVTVKQNQNIADDQILGIKRIFNPEYLEYTSPMSFKTFTDVTSNTEEALGVSCSSQGQFIGFIKTMKYAPTTQGGIASFKLLSGSCNTGDFNNDFNNDFLIGNCN